MLLETEPLDIDTIVPPAHRAAQWHAAVTAGLDLSFDDWLVSRLTTAGHGPEGTACAGFGECSVRYRQGPVVFELVHGAAYAVSRPSTLDTSAVCWTVTSPTSRSVGPASGAVFPGSRWRGFSSPRSSGRYAVSMPLTSSPESSRPF